MLVESVSVKNFKLLGDFSVGGLRPVTLVGGDNGCGKTTLLEAVFLCFDQKWDKGHMPPILSPLRNASIMNEDAFAHLFHEANFDAPITVSCVMDGVSRIVSAAPAPVDASESIDVPFADMRKANNGAPMEIRADRRLMVRHSEGGKVKSSAIVTLDHEGVKAKAERVDAPVKFVQIVRDGLIIGGLTEDTDNLSQLEIKGDKSAVLSALQIVAPKAMDVTVASVMKTPLVFVRLDGVKRMVPSMLLGAGTQKVLSLALSLYSHNDGLFLLDEVTVGWHHSHLVELWQMIFRACKEHNHQVIATTHSDEGITAFVKAAKAEAAEDNCCYIRMDPPRKSDQSGKINPTPSDYEMLRASREMNVEMR